MEILLLSVTAVSLLVAVVMSAAAWRLSREERARGVARVAALTAASSNVAVADESRIGKTIAVAAAAPERVAIGEARTSAPWTAARVSAFASTTKPTARAEPARADAADVMRPAGVAGSAFSNIGDSFLGSAATTPPGNGRQRALAVAAVLLFVIALAGGYWSVFGSRSSGPTIAAASTTAPLELVSLRHERRGARLAVTGLVRNPLVASPLADLTAVVFFFDQKGAFITSARAGVDYQRLSPGDESPFVIDVEAPANVARYRVSFRNEGGVVPHVDRRSQEPVNTTALSRSAS